LSAEYKTSWARALAKSSRFSAGKEEGEGEGDGEGEGGAQQQRRQAFIDKLADMANSIYEVRYGVLPPMPTQPSRARGRGR